MLFLLLLETALFLLQAASKNIFDSFVAAMGNHRFLSLAIQKLDYLEAFDRIDRNYWGAICMRNWNVGRHDSMPRLPSIDQSQRWSP